MGPLVLWVVVVDSYVRKSGTTELSELAISLIKQ